MVSEDQVASKNNSANSVNVSWAEMIRCSVSASKVNYFEGSCDSLLLEDYNEDGYDGCPIFPRILNAELAVIGAHVSGNCSKPHVKVRSYPDLPIGDRERDGYLTDRMIEVCSCCLEATALPGKYALTTCLLGKKSLRNVEILRYHQFLKHLDLSRNCLESIEALGNLPFLEHLDVSHNLLAKLADFDAPLNLSYLDCSYNLIEQMRDLHEFWGLVHLNLSHNLIDGIFGLESLKYLSFLDLSHNKIQRLENINNLNIQTLHLDHNSISICERGDAIGVHTLIKLVHLSISHNRLESLEFLCGTRSLESVDISENRIQDLLEVTHLNNMPYLTSINLLGNPVVERPKFRAVCVNRIERLEELNGEVISIEEKSEMKFISTKTPDREFRYNNIIIETFNQQKPLDIDSTVIPCYQKFASMILLVGPMSTKRDELLSRILANNPLFSKKGISHTTRPPTDGEVDGRDYYFVREDEFKKLLLDGKFICCSHKYGHSYGFSYKEICKISEEIGILFITCDITSAMQIRAKFLNCKLILSLPKSERTHRMYLQKKYSASPWISSYIEGYLINYRNSKLYIQRSGSFHLGSGRMNMSQKDHGKDIDSVEKPSPILKPQTKSEDTHRRKEQIVSFHNNLEQEFLPHTDSDYGPVSVSQTLIPGTSKPFPLSTISVDSNIARERITSVSSDSSNNSYSIGPKSASKAILVNDSMRLTNVSKESDLGGQRVFEDMRGRGSEKLSIGSYAGFLNSSISADLVNSVSESIKAQDEYVLRILLAKNNMPSMSTGSQSSDTFDSFKSERSSLSADTQSHHETMFMDYFIETQLMRRQLYLRLYNKYPGLFFTQVHTDEPDEAYEKLKEVLRACVEMQHRHIYVTKTQCKNTYVCKEMRDAKLKMFLDMVD